MGNTVLSTGAFVAVQIDDPGSHYGGSTLKGRIFLDVQKSSVSADSLNIRFYGCEHSCVVYYVTRGSGKNRRRERKTAHAYEYFYNVDYPLSFYDDNVVLKGRYEYPFEIKLPLNIPGKQKSESGGSYLDINYHIEARLHRHGMLTWDVKNSMEVLMLDPPYNRIPTPVFPYPSTVPVHSWCCFRSGFMSLAIKLDSNNIVESEAFRVFYEVNNQSTCRVKAVEISVNRSFHCRAGGHSHHSSSCISQERIESTELQNSSPIDIKNENNTRSTVHVEEEEIRRMIESLAKGNQFLKVVIPTARNSVPSFTGALGSVSYNLRVQIKTPFGVEDPWIDCPLILHRTTFSFEHVVPAVEHEFTVPPDWRPMGNPSAPVQFELPRAVIGTTVADLVASLKQGDQFNEVNIFRDWVSANGVHSLTSPQMIGEIFSSIKSENSDPYFAEIIGKAMNNNVPCFFIVTAAGALQPRENHRIAALLIAFSAYCGEKQLAPTAFQQLDLPPYAISSVLIYYTNDNYRV